MRVLIIAAANLTLPPTLYGTVLWWLLAFGLCRYWPGARRRAPGERKSNPLNLPPKPKVEAYFAGEPECPEFDAIAESLGWPPEGKIVDLRPSGHGPNRRWS